MPVTARIGIRDALAGGNKPVDDGLRDVLRLALGRMGVHPEARRRVDLDDRAARLADRGRDVRADEVDAGDVEADDPGGGLGDLDVVGVGLDRPVDRRPAGRHVAGQGELHPDAVGGHAVDLESLIPDERLCGFVEGDAGQHLLVADASPGVLVGGVDELADGVDPIPDDRSRDALGNGRDAAADDEDPVVVAADIRLDDDVTGAALAERPGKARSDGLLRTEVEGDAPTVVAVERLDDAREPEALGRRDGLILGLDDLRTRHRQASRIEQPVGEALVGGDVDGDRRRLRRHGRPDALLVDALAELDEAVTVEADVRDVAADRLVDERLGRRAEGLPLGEADEAFELGEQVELR